MTYEFLQPVTVTTPLGNKPIPAFALFVFAGGNTLVWDATNRHAFLPSTFWLSERNTTAKIKSITPDLNSIDNLAKFPDGGLRGLAIILGREGIKLDLTRAARQALSFH